METEKSNIDISKNTDHSTIKDDTKTIPLKIDISQYSVWRCYMFGNKPGRSGMIYQPQKDQVPNWFIRWMMKICFGCTWIRED